MNINIETIDKYFTVKTAMILAVCLALVLLSFYAILRVRDDANKKSSLYVNPKYIATQGQFPTGIILPTASIPPSELDITKITPADGTVDVPVQKALQVVFSRPVKESEIEFSVVPDYRYTIEIVEDTLTITPLEDYLEGTLYSFRINIINHPEKVRLYRFWTVGDINPVLPDTREQNVIEEFEQIERTRHPDIFVVNNTPFENELFAATTAYEPEIPSRHYLIIRPKIENREEVEAAVYVWLQVLGLTNAQIENFDIRYVE